MGDPVCVGTLLGHGRVLRRNTQLVIRLPRQHTNDRASERFLTEILLD